MTAQREFWSRTVGERSAIEHATKVAPSALAALVAQVRWMAQRGETFSSEHVMRELPVLVRECLERAPNAVGATFTQLARAGVIERTGATVVSLRAGARGRRIQLWTGKR